MSKASEAIVSLLRRIEPGKKPISLYEIGIPLIMEQKFTEDDVLNGLYWLQSEKIIEILGDNRLRLLKKLPDAF